MSDEAEQLQDDRPPSAPRPGAPRRRAYRKPGDVVMKSLIDAMVEIRFQSFLADLPDPLLGIDSRGIVRIANAQAESIFGCPRDQLVGRPVDALLTEPASRTGTQDWGLAAKAPGPRPTHTRWTSREFIAHRAGGGDVPVEVTLGVVGADDGILTIAALRDLTERTQAQEAQARLAAIVQGSRDAILGKTLEGVVNSWNPGAEALFGYTAQEMIGQPIDVLIPPEERDTERERRDRVIRGLGLAEYETVRLRKDGTLVDVAVSLSPIEGPGGETVGIASICRDVSERKRAEAKFQGLLESAPDAIVVVDAGGLIRLVNRQTERLFGYSRSELVGQPVERLIPPRLAGHHPDLRGGFFLHPSVRAMGANLELAARRKDGSEFPVDISLAPLETEEGPVVSAAVRDVTERKRAEMALLEREEQLAMARDQAQEASRLKSQFLANMSHEIRTPMNGVLGMADLLLSGTLDPEQRRRVMSLRESGQSLLTIINDILDFSKVEAGKLELESKDFNLPAALESVVSLLSSVANDKGLTLELHVGQGVPTWVRGDAVRLRQILTNLLGNAVKFTERGGVDVSVTVEAPGRTRFEVRDSGIGIEPSTQARLLDPFFQGDASTTRRFGGTGLGLAICRQLVELMGGRLAFRSTPGVGSTFWFDVDLPAVRPAAAGEPGPLSRPTVREPVPEGPGPVDGSTRILLVDDSEVNREVGRGLLKSLGHQVDTVGSGPEALEAVRKGSYAAVLMDCLMPGMDGYQATRMIRAIEGPTRHIPIIALTAAAMSGDRERCLAAGMDDYVSKPFDVGMLTAALSRCRPGSGPQPEPHPAPEGRDNDALPRQLRLIESRVPPEDFGRICHHFLSTTSAMMERLDTAVHAADSDTVIDVAHRLTGTAGTFGAVGLSGLCRRVEEAERTGAAGIVDLLAEMRREYDRVRRVVTSFLPENAGV